VGITIEWETDEQQMERCDHEGTTEPLEGGRVDLGLHGVREDVADALPALASLDA
jgi:hypothetical protein